MLGCSGGHILCSQQLLLSARPLSRAKFMSQLAGHLDSPVHPAQHRPPLLGKGPQEVPKPGGGRRPTPGKWHQVLSPHSTNSLRLTEWGCQ